MDRIKAIQNFAAKRQQEEDALLRAENEKRENLINAISAKAEQIFELIKVGRAAFDAGIITKDSGFISEGIKHRFGFHLAWKNAAPYDIIGVGFYGGGVCGESFFADGNGTIYRGLDGEPIKDFFDKAERFLKAIDSFECRFYEYIDQVTDNQ
mgnify:CR=1 FL=1